MQTEITQALNAAYPASLVQPPALVAELWSRRNVVAGREAT